MMSFLRMISSPENYARAKAYYEEQAFQRQLSQGELAAPMVISDTQRPVRSMTNGRVYDSKSELRREYSRAGVQEVGNEKPQPRRTWSEQKDRERQHKAECRATLEKAHSQMGHGAV